MKYGVPDFVSRSTLDTNAWCHASDAGTRCIARMYCTDIVFHGFTCAVMPFCGTEVVGGWYIQSYLVLSDSEKHAMGVRFV